MSTSIEIDDDPEAFLRFAVDQGWGDGLPLVPPRPEIVAAYVEASGLAADVVLGDVAPAYGRCTVELLAINAVMAGAPAEAMPLLCAAIDALCDVEFNLFAVNTTTNAVVPAAIVNGAQRHRLSIPMAESCLGGAAGPAPSIGRAVRLVMRNVGAQAPGTGTMSVMGQPGRVSGLVFAEWEEQSPWAPLAERRGVVGDAVTVCSTTGTLDILDPVAGDVSTLLEVIGKSLAYVGSAPYFTSSESTEVVVGLPPAWAQMIAVEHPELDDVQRILWDHAALPVSWFPAPHRLVLTERDRVDDSGSVRLCRRAEDLIVVVCGGKGGLHGVALHSLGPTRAVTRAVRAPAAPA